MNTIINIDDAVLKMIFFNIKAFSLCLTTGVTPWKEALLLI